MAQAQSIGQADVRHLVSRGEYAVALELAYVMLSERLGTLPDGGDALYGSLFTPDECEALADVLHLAEGGSLPD